MERADFGEYSCHASNEHGDARDTTIQLSGHARPADFKSSPAGTEANSFLIQWSSFSFSPIEEFKLETRCVVKLKLEYNLVWQFSCCIKKYIIVQSGFIWILDVPSPLVPHQGPWAVHLRWQVLHHRPGGCNTVSCQVRD